MHVKSRDLAFVNYLLPECSVSTKPRSLFLVSLFFIAIVNPFDPCTPLIFLILYHSSVYRSAIPNDTNNVYNSKLQSVSLNTIDYTIEKYCKRYYSSYYTKMLLQCSYILHSVTFLQCIVITYLFCFRVLLLCIACNIYFELHITAYAYSSIAGLFKSWEL